MKLFTLALVSLVALASTSVASPVGGEQRASGTLAPEQTKGFTIEFRAGESYTIAAMAEGAGDLDCFLFDDNENLVVKDNDDTNTCLLEGTPIRTGNFHLILKNSGAKSVSFRALAK